MKSSAWLEMLILRVGAAGTNPAERCRVEGTRDTDPRCPPHHSPALVVTLSPLGLEVNRIVAAKAWSKMSRWQLCPP